MNNTIIEEEDKYYRCEECYIWFHINDKMLSFCYFCDYSICYECEDVEDIKKQTFFKLYNNNLCCNKCYIIKNMKHSK